MRLINARKLLELNTLDLEDFFEDRIPKYVILSHTWDDQELSFQDIALPSSRSKTGFNKVKELCRLALESNLEYAWVDTCCIDKSSSAELTESINSMFRWYQNAEICYVYLSDLVSGDRDATRIDFPKCRWFTRGWTLQELIAPRLVYFLDQKWHSSGSRDEFRDVISVITGIDPSALIGNSHPDLLKSYSIAHRMSWASSRQTTRTEDEAYCLLGIFDICMPLIYGEGNKAFRRLQEEIIKSSNDLTILAWSPKGDFEYCSILAPSPVVFSKSADIQKFAPSVFHPEFTLNNRGLRLKISLWRARGKQADSEQVDTKSLRYFLRLGGDPSEPIGIFLARVGPIFYFRDGRMLLEKTSESEVYGIQATEIYIAVDPPKTTRPIDLTSFSKISFVVPFHPDRWYPTRALSEELWDYTRRLFFGPTSHIVQVLELQVRIPETGVSVPVVVLYESLRNPGACLVFNPNDWGRNGLLVKHLFQLRNVNEKFRMDDLLWEYPIIKNLKDYFEVTVSKENYAIKALMQLGIEENISTSKPVYSLVFEISKKRNTEPVGRLRG